MLQNTPSSGIGHPVHGRTNKFVSPSYSDDEDDDDLVEDDDEQRAFWDECDQVAKKNPAPARAETKTAGSAAGSVGGAEGSTKGGEKGKKKADKNEVL